MNTQVTGRIYRVIDKTTGETIKIGSTIRTINQRFGQPDYKRRFINHFVEEVKSFNSSELDFYDPNDSYCPFLWHLVASEHLEMLRSGTFRKNPLSNLFSPLDQKFFHRFGASYLSSLGGKIGGRKHVESGHLQSISSKGGKSGGPSNGHKNGLKLAKERRGICAPGMAAKGGSKGGLVSGRMSAENGHLSRLRTPEHQRYASKYANHSRWHTKKNIKNPNCDLCNKEKECPIPNGSNVV